jgi:hypothetical protein
MIWHLFAHLLPYGFYTAADDAHGPKLDAVVAATRGRDTLLISWKTVSWKYCGVNPLYYSAF